MRVTSQTQTANAIIYMQQKSAALAKYQDQVSSGVKLKLPSDDPSGYSTFTRANAASARFAVYTQTMSTATGDLNTGVGALQDASNALIQAKQIAQNGINSTSDDPQAFEALASQVDGLISRMTSDGNVQGSDGSYLFSGTATKTPPFAAAGVDAQGNPTAIAYNGSPDRARSTIGPEQTVDTKYSGAQVFQSTGTDAFQALIGLRDTLRNTSLSGVAKAQALTQQLSAVDSANNGILNTMGEQSSDLSRLSALQSRISDLNLAATSQANDISGTDYASAIVNMNQEQTALQATMQVSAQLLQTSFLNFIK